MSGASERRATDIFEMDVASAQEVLAWSRRSAAKLYPDHIRNEDSSLFPMTDQAPRSEELPALNQNYEEAEEGSGKDIRDRFMHWVEQVGRRLG
jgi:hemerythrin-like domain-containing protein